VSAIVARTAGCRRWRPRIDARLSRISNPITPATARCSNWIAGNPSKAKLNPPPHSGQALQLPLAPLPTTSEPLMINK
jgi:hypothetical protein